MGYCIERFGEIEQHQHSDLAPVYSMSDVIQKLDEGSSRAVPLPKTTLPRVQQRMLIDEIINLFKDKSFKYLVERGKQSDRAIIISCLGCTDFSNQDNNSSLPSSRELAIRDRKIEQCHEEGE